MKPKIREVSVAAISRLLMCLIIVGSLLILSPPVRGAPDAQDPSSQNGTEAIYLGVSTAVQFDISPPLRDIPPAEIDPNQLFGDFDPPSGLEKPMGPQSVDSIVQATAGAPRIPAPIVSFDAFDNQLTYTPPDPVGDVGPNHYVAMSNVHFAVYDKAGNLLYGPVPNNTLWSGFGGPCESENAGDPIVLYDQMADRWMLTQFSDSTAPWYNCVALSTSGDPTSTYYRYAFATPNGFPDYPKYGIWPDAYYISTREFNGPFVGIGAYALNREQMLAGNPTPQVISFLIPPGSQPYNLGDGLLPADIDGISLPPAGSPNYYMGSMDNGAGYGAPQDALTLWEFHVDWVTPGNSSFTLMHTIPTAPFDSIYPCSPGSRDCIPQPDTSEKVDILSYRQRPLWRLAYRNLGTHEALVTNQSVEAATEMAGIRWYEVRDPGGSPFIYQQGTYAPGISDGVHRWMGSIAMDHDGNMALGYSASNATNTYPSIWYTGRLASDPLGEMSQGEGSFVDGSGSQLSTGSRWGDYSSMNVDPVDDCTFWYINEYYPATSSTEWYLHIGAFKFPSCQVEGTDLSIVKSDTPDPVVPGGALVYTLSANNAGPNDVTSPVTVTDDLPTGVTVSNISAPSWTCSQVGQQIECTMPSLPVGPAPAIVVTTAAPAATGYITNTASVTSTLEDYNPFNNSDQAGTLVDTAPQAGDDSYDTPEDTDLVVAAPGVLDNDSDPDSDPLAAALSAPPTHGSVVLALDGAFTYSPDLNYNGPDAFGYILSDGYLTDTAVVSIDVTPVNDPPLAEDDAYSTDEDAPLVVAAPGVLDNDDDLDGDVLTATLLGGPLHGEVTLDLDGSFTYTPSLNYNGTDSFTYTASDGMLTDTATVDLTIDPVNDAPVVDAGRDQQDDEGAILSFSGVFTDPGLLAWPLAGESILWTFGDGSTLTGTLTPTHAYGDEGIYVVTLTVSDTLGGVGTDTLVVTATNVAPALAPLPDLMVDIGQALTLTGTFTDPGWLDAHVVAIAWGDGMTDTLNLVAGVSDFVTTYTFTTVGVHTVTVTVEDGDGGQDSLDLIVTVNPFRVYLPIIVRQ